MPTVLGLLTLPAEAHQPDNKLLIIYGAVILVALIFLGLRFLVSMFEIITAPTASLKHHGENNHFFQSMVIVFLGGSIGTLILLLNQSKLAAAWEQYSSSTASGLAMLNSNLNYRGIAQEWAQGKLDSNFSSYVVDNLIWLPVVLTVLWIVIGLLTFFFSKILGGQTTAAGFLGAVAYGTFFINIAVGLLGVALIQAMAAKSMPPLDGMSIAGLVLLAYGLILWLMGANTAPENTSGQTAGVMIFLLIIIGGVAFLIYSQVVDPKYKEFAAAVESLDPSKGQEIPQ